MLATAHIPHPELRAPVDPYKILPVFVGDDHRSYQQDQRKDPAVVHDPQRDRNDHNGSIVPATI